jgi:hypothetical protein
MPLDVSIGKQVNVCTAFFNSWLPTETLRNSLKGRLLRSGLCNDVLRFQTIPAGVFSYVSSSMGIDSVIEQHTTYSELLAYYCNVQYLLSHPFLIIFKNWSLQFIGQWSLNCQLLKFGGGKKIRKLGVSFP